MGTGPKSELLNVMHMYLGEYPVHDPVRQGVVAVAQQVLLIYVEVVVRVQLPELRRRQARQNYVKGTSEVQGMGSACTCSTKTEMCPPLRDCAVDCAGTMQRHGRDT